MSEYNIYCDESCHLEHDQSNVMALGAIILPKDKKEIVSRNIAMIKKSHGIKPYEEIKWTKIGKNTIDLYCDIIDYFFHDDDIRFRVLIADKTKLDHDKYDQSHDDWYYKMYFQMLNMLFCQSDVYNVYIDIKDTHSFMRTEKLRDVCSKSHYDFNHKCIKKIQPIQSHEVQMMQIVDILIGAVCRANRNIPKNIYKQAVIDSIKKQSGFSLITSTTYGERKFNIFKWEGK